MREEGLERFVAAQAPVIDRVRAELSAGRKSSHWMWFVFPQLRGLGQSPMAWFYGLAGVPEARAYDAHEVLGPRLRGCAALVLSHSGRSAEEIMGPVDALKLRSCATLFAEVSQEPAVFARLLETFHGGQSCPRTDEILENARPRSHDRGTGA
ncbi:DUF1810 domain-containing protein [Sulfitobacter sp. LCG007]